MSDPQEHFGVSTSTGNGAYDQICAFSQSLVNKGFKELYSVSKDLQQIYSLKTDIGKIEATLLPPEIIVPGADEPSKIYNVIFLLKFDSGKLFNAKGDIVIPSLKNFVLAYKVDLEVAENNAKNWKKQIVDYEDRLGKETDPTQQQQIRKYLNATKKKLDYFIRTYAVPGDYSFQRLYMKLSSTRWSNFENQSKYSQAGLRSDNTPYPMNEWIIDMQTGHGEMSAGRILSTFLEEWAQRVENQELSCLGVSFKPPTQIVSDAVLRPTHLTHQTIPYKVKDPITKAYSGETGFTETGNRNCLLYCEMVDDHAPPGGTIVTWSGNFATKPSIPGAKDQIDGSFLLGRKVFFEAVILKHLSQLNQATSIFHETIPIAKMDDTDNKEFPASLPIKYGGHPDHPMRDDKFYAFETNNPKYDPEITTKYVWDKHQKLPDENLWDGVTPHPMGAPYANLKKWAEDTMHSEVTWVPGEASVSVSGKTIMSDDALWDQGLNPPNFADNNLTAFARCTIEVKWEMTIRIVPSLDAKGNRILTVDVDSGPEKDAHLSVVQTRGLNKNLIPGRRQDTILHYIKAVMKMRVEEITKNITEAVQKAGKFTYPARGVLNFSAPAFTKHGDFLATVTHVPLKEGVKVDVPTPYQDPSLGEAEMGEYVVVADPPVTEPLHLEWKVNTPNFFANKKGEVEFICKNNTGTEQRFNQIVISVKVGSDAGKNSLFAIDGFVIDSGVPVKTGSSTQSGVTVPVVAHEASSSAHPATTSSSTHPTTTTSTSASGKVEMSEDTESEFTLVEGEEGGKAPTTSKIDPQQDTLTDKSAGQHPSLLGRIKNLLPGSGKPTTEKPLGTIKIEKSFTEVPIKLIIRSPQAAAENQIASRETHGREWQAVIQTRNDNLNFFALKPDEWVKVVFKGTASVVGEQKVYIDEIWADANGGTVGHRIEPRMIGIIDEDDL